MIANKLRSGSNQPTKEYTADGALAKGDLVVLNANSTVSTAGNITVSVSESIPSGSASEFMSGSTFNVNASKIAYFPDTADKFLCVFSGSGSGSTPSGMYAVIGSVSSAAITYGTPYRFDTTTAVNDVSLTFDPSSSSNSFVVTWSQPYGYAVAGTISGTTITYGSRATFNSGNTNGHQIVFDPNTAGKFIISFSDRGQSYYGAAIVGTVSGTTITLGTKTYYESTTTDYQTAAYDSGTANKFVTAWRGYAYSNKGRAVVGTVSGTSISFGAVVTANNASTSDPELVADPHSSTHFALYFRDGGNNDHATVLILTRSGTGLSVGSEYTTGTGSVEYAQIAYDPNTQWKILLCYNVSSTAVKTMVGTISYSGTLALISWSSESTVYSGRGDYIAVAFDPSSGGKFVMKFTDFTVVSGRGMAIMGQLAGSTTSTNVSASNFIGASDDVYANGATATVHVNRSTDNNQSGLVAGTDYYLQAVGTLSATPDSPSVLVGTARTTSSLKIKGSNAA